MPHVPDQERCRFELLASPLGTFHRVQLRFGFQDEQDVPAALRVAQDLGLHADLDEAFYFLSRITV